MTATQDDVSAACERIAERGERPTVERVRAELGGASPNTVTPMVRAWRERREGRSTDCSDEAVASNAELAILPASVQRAFDQLSTAVRGLPQAIAAAIAESVEIERRRTRLELEAIEIACQDAIGEAKMAAADERSACEAVRVEASQLSAALAEREKDVANLSERNETTKAELQRMAGARDEECSARDEAESRTGVLMEDVFEARKETALAQEAAKTAKTELTRMRTECVRLTAEVDDARERVAFLSTEIAVHRQRADGERQRAERAEADAERSRQERAAAEIAVRDALARVALIETDADAPTESPLGSRIRTKHGPG